MENSSMLCCLDQHMIGAQLMWWIIPLCDQLVYWHPTWSASTAEKVIIITGIPCGACMLSFITSFAFWFTLTNHALQIITGRITALCHPVSVLNGCPVWHQEDLHSSKFTESLQNTNNVLITIELLCITFRCLIQLWWIPRLCGVLVRFRKPNPTFSDSFLVSFVALTSYMDENTTHLIFPGLSDSGILNWFLSAPR